MAETNSIRYTALKTSIDEYEEEEVPMTLPPANDIDPQRAHSTQHAFIKSRSDTDATTDTIISPVAFVALILVTSLFLSAIIFQSNDEKAHAIASHNNILKNGKRGNWPIVISTWDFVDAVEIAYDTIVKTNDSLEAVVSGCSFCEYNPQFCGFSVGYGAKPDSAGEVTLDALVMYGPSHTAGAVGQLREVKNAIGVARAVMEHTTHTLLVGESATEFALQMGFKRASLDSPRSSTIYQWWKDQDDCQPNAYIDVPDADVSCPPYAFDERRFASQMYRNDHNNDDDDDDDDEWPDIEMYETHEHSRRDAQHSGSYTNHDTIGLIAIDASGDMTVGTSTNGLRYKIHGRVGDAALVGHGAYVKQGVGGAVATGNGDIIILFAPARIAVHYMQLGKDVHTACKAAFGEIIDAFESFNGALICMDASGNFAVVKQMESDFHFVYKDSSMLTAQLMTES